MSGTVGIVWRRIDERERPELAAYSIGVLPEGWVRQSQITPSAKARDAFDVYVRMTRLADFWVELDLRSRGAKGTLHPLPHLTLTHASGLLGGFHELSFAGLIEGGVSALRFAPEGVARLAC